MSEQTQRPVCWPLIVVIVCLSLSNIFYAIMAAEWREIAEMHQKNTKAAIAAAKATLETNELLLRELARK